MCSNSSVTDNKEEFSTSYQVTISLLIAEQQGIWTRMAGFSALNVMVIPWTYTQSIQFPSITYITSIIGIVLSFVLYRSVKRSWGFRNSFAETAEGLERKLSLGNKYGALLAKKSLSNKNEGISQPWLSYLTCAIFGCIYAWMLPWTQFYR